MTDASTSLAKALRAFGAAGLSGLWSMCLSGIERCGLIQNRWGIYGALQPKMAHVTRDPRMPPRMNS